MSGIKQCHSNIRRKDGCIMKGGTVTVGEELDGGTVVPSGGKVMAMGSAEEPEEELAELSGTSGATSENLWSLQIS